MKKYKQYIRVANILLQALYGLKQKRLRKIQQKLEDFSCKCSDVTKDSRIFQKAVDRCWYPSAEKIRSRISRNLNCNSGHIAMICEVKLCVQQKNKKTNPATKKIHGFTECLRKKTLGFGRVRIGHAKARRNLAAAGRAGQLGQIITTLSKLIVLMLPPLSSLRPAWLYRIRGGIEGTNSGLKRKTGLGQLRVRGRPRVFYSILLKIVGWNILRAAACAKMREIVYARANASVFWLNFVFLRMSM